MSILDTLLETTHVTNLDGSEDAPKDLEGTDVEQGDTGSDENDDTENKSVDVTTDEEGDETVVGDENTNVDEVEAGEVSDDIDTDLLEVNEDKQELDDAEEDVEKADEAVASTERLLATLALAKESKQVNYTVAVLAQEHIKVIGASLGLPASSVPSFSFSKESFSTMGAVTLSTETVMEKIKNFIKTVFTAIANAMKWIAEKGRVIYAKIFQNFDKLEKYVATLEGKLKGIGNDKPKNAKMKSNGLAITASVGGKFVGAVNAANILAEAANEINANWETRTIVTEAKEIVKGFGDDINGMKAAAEWDDDSFIEKHLENLIGSIPFRKNSIEAENYGVKGGEGEIVTGSPELPRNKRIVNVSNKNTGVITIKLASLNGGSVAEDREVNVLPTGDISTVLRSVKGTIATMKALKKHTKETEEAGLLISKLIFNQQNAAAKLLKESDVKKDNVVYGMMQQQAKWMKTLLNLLREPGLSFAHYGLLEVKGLLDYCAASIKQYGKAIEGDVKALPNKEHVLLEHKA